MTRYVFKDPADYYKWMLDRYADGTAQQTKPCPHCGQPMTMAIPPEYWQDETEPNEGQTWRDRPPMI